MGLIEKELIESQSMFFAQILESLVTIEAGEMQRPGVFEIEIATFAYLSLDRFWENHDDRQTARLQTPGYQVVEVVADLIG